MKIQVHSAKRKKMQITLRSYTLQLFPTFGPQSHQQGAAQSLPGTAGLKYSLGALSNCGIRFITPRAKTSATSDIPKIKEKKERVGTDNSKPVVILYNYITLHVYYVCGFLKSYD